VVPARTKLRASRRKSSVKARKRQPNISQQAGAAITRDHFAYALFQHLEELVVGRMDRNGGQAGLFFENPKVRTVIRNWMPHQVYDRIRASQFADATASPKA
jgi:hypothetical protein